jgi:hypothetical protein
MKVEQRPVLGLSGFNVLFENEAPDALLTKVIIHYVNGGKSAAENCQHLMKITAGKLPQPESSMAIPVPNECLDNAPHLSGTGGTVLLPGVENQATVNAPTDLAQYWARISKGTIRLYLVGCVDYDFGDEWDRTRLCMVYLPDQRTFEFCPAVGQQVERHISESDEQWQH